MNRVRNVKLRNGRTVEVETNPPTPLDKKAKKENTLLYAKMGTLAVSGVPCEKYIAHKHDGTLATCMVMYRWENSVAQTSSVLCEKHAQDLINYLAKSLPPSGNTGVTDLFSRGDSQP